jgi:hypothetical protein
MKKNILLILLLLPLLTTAQDSLSYQVLGAFRAGKMYLRWAPATVRAWQLGRQQGDAVLASIEFKNPQAWKTDEKFKKFREGWRLATAITSTPLILKSVYNAFKGGPQLLEARNTGLVADEVSTPALKANLVKQASFFGLDDLFSHFKKKFIDLGNSDGISSSLARYLTEHLSNINSISHTDISDDFLRLFASSNDAGRDLLVAKFFPSSGSSNLLEFQRDLKIDGFFDLIKGDANLAKAWEALYTSLPTDLRHFARDREHLLFLQNTDVQLALAWIKRERPNLFTIYPNLTPGEIASLCYYTTRNGYQINFWRRGLSVLPGIDWTTEHAIRYSAFLNRAFANLPAYRSSIRLIRLEGRSLAEVAGFSIGQRLPYPNYISTAKNNQSYFISGFNNRTNNLVENFILEIENPSGIKVIDLEPFSQADGELEALVTLGKALEIKNIEYKIFPTPTAEELLASYPQGSLREARLAIKEELDAWATSAANPNAIDEALLIPGTPAYEKAIKIRTLTVKIVEQN